MLLSRLRAWQNSTNAQVAMNSRLDVQGPLAIAARLPRVSHISTGTRGESPQKPIVNGSALRCLSYRSLSAAEQGHVSCLERRIRRAMATEPQRTFVACCAVCSERSDSASSGAGAIVSGSGTCTTSRAFTGVNFALHALANAQGGGRQLKGLLKGCAEQNALGTVAAHGLPYAAVSQVFLLSSEALALDASPSGETRCGSHGALYPCAECWQHLAAVATMRQGNNLAPLQFFTCLPRADAARLRVIDHFDNMMCGASSPPPITVTLLTF